MTRDGPVSGLEIRLSAPPTQQLMSGKQQTKETETIAIATFGTDAMHLILVQ